MVIVAIPSALVIRFGVADIDKDEDTVAAADGLVELVDLDRAVAALAAPAYIEYQALVGLASIDSNGIDRALVFDILDLDYEAIYKGNKPSLDAALLGVAAADRDLVLDRTRTLGDEIDRLSEELAIIRSTTENFNGSPAQIYQLFTDLSTTLDEAAVAKRDVLDLGAIPGDLERYRARSAALSWVLDTAGDTSQAILEAATVPAAHQIPVAQALAAHHQAALQFAAQLPSDIAGPFLDITLAAPNPLPDIPVEATLVGDIDPDRIRASARHMTDQMTYLRSLSTWAEGYYGQVTTDVTSLAQDARGRLTRTTHLVLGTLLVGLIAALLMSLSLLRPLLRLGRRAQRISQGKLDDEPLPVKGPRDLRSLTTTMNTMLDTLGLVERQAAALAAGRLDDASLGQESPGRLGAAIRRSVVRLTEVTTSLQTSEARASAIVSHALVAIWTIDPHGRIVSANAAAERLVLEPEVDQIGTRLSRYIGVTRGECELRRDDGSHLHLNIDHSIVHTPHGVLRTVFAEDITERKEYERRLAHQARHDELTGLANRFAMLEWLTERTTAGIPATVLFLDVDGFKSVNDSHGHGVGDMVLAEIARRLRTEVRGGTIVARLGGDEFVVATDDVLDEQAGIALGRRLIEWIEQPYQAGEAFFTLSASVGVAHIRNGEEALEVIHRADAAVYQAKNLGRARVVFFDESFQSQVEHRAAMEQALREAVTRGELQMYLQPIFDLATGAVVATEALARWERPGVGFVPPMEFIPIAEESNLIFDITKWMLYQAAERVVAWRRIDPDCSLRISVNLSGRHLVDGDLVSDLSEVLNATGADPRMLELELTESTLLADLGAARTVLEVVRALGITIAVDDFGTGYSSMAYLRHLEVDVIKVDRSFVSGSDQNGFDATAIDAMVNFGRVLGVEVVAEGVETDAQLDIVRSHGCSRAQGYLLGMPAPADEIDRVLGLGGRVRQAVAPTRR